MIVKALTLRNFKSYGNVPTRIEFSEDAGELVLLVGKNGAGKTSLIDGLSYVGYNVVYSRDQKRIPLKELANRMNGQLVAGIEFKTPKVEHGSITRTANPSSVRLVEDGVPYGKAGRISDRLQEHIGFDLESYRSFISMSINDFKNFIELSAEDKRVLLDKMFSMDYINQLGKVVKEMKKENDRKLEVASTVVSVTKREMDALEQTAARISARKADEDEQDTQSLVDEMRAHKEKYVQYAADVQQAKADAKQVSDQLAAYKTKMQEVLFKRRDVEKQLALYGSGKCPTCHTELSGDAHLGYASTLRQKLDKLLAMEQQGARGADKLQTKYNEMDGRSREASNSYAAVVAQIQQVQRGLEKAAAKRKEEAERASAAAAADEIQQMLDDMARRQGAAEANVEEAARQGVVFKKMAQMFSEEGVKQTIISNIVRPINAFIAENMAIVGLPHRVVLDRSFDAAITHLGSSVNTQTLSTGEAKIINICIMLAYIKLIRTRKHINLLFLDEVFASIDHDNIYLILKLLREFARSYNVNVFLVHHSELQDSYFDRIIKINKNVFSTIEDTRQQM